MTIEKCKLITETSKGTRLKHDVTLQYEDGRIYFLQSPFCMKDEIKSMMGSKWHGYDTEPRKIWSIEDCQRNRFQLAYLKGDNPYDWFDRELIKHHYGRPLMPHQCDLADSGLTYHFNIWAAEMGCVDGNAIVHVNRAGRGFSISLAELYQKFSTAVDHPGKLGQKTWDASITTRIRGYTGGGLGLIPIKNVILKGIKKVIKLSTSSGKSLLLTPDHEVCIDGFGIGQFARADSLKPGDTIIVSDDHGEHTRQRNPKSVQAYTATDTVLGVEPAGTKGVYDVVCDSAYHNFVANGIVVHNCGKTLSAIELMEKSGIKKWFYCAPKSVLKAIKREFKKWSLSSDIEVELLTYEALTRMMDEWPKDRKPPMGVIFDESSRLKTATSNRTKAAQMLADLIRFHYGHDGYVILMSGTPSPKSPVDWWAQAEITYPGFLKEGSPKALEQRLAFMVEESYDAGTFQKRIGWKDDENKCKTCGQYEEAHDFLDPEGNIQEDVHKYVASVNEISLMHERLGGLVIVKHKKDCLKLPDKTYRRIICKPSKSVLRVAQALAGTQSNAMQTQTLLRELSDGFQYQEQADGMRTCEHCKGTGEVKEWVDPNDPERCYTSVEMMDPETVASLQETTTCCPGCGGDKEVKKYIRITKEIPCPKQNAIIELLEECEDTGRIVIFAGFTGSVDRCVNICTAQKWDVVRCDGRGFTVFLSNSDGRVETLDVDALDYWANVQGNQRVAFVAHPESGGMGLTLTESRMAVFYSNTFKPEYRSQSEDRIHRIGADENRGCVIVDLLHLPTDDKTLTTIRENRKIELLTMGEIMAALKDETPLDGELLEV